MGRSYRAPVFNQIDANISADTVGVFTNIEHRDRIFYDVTWSNGIGFSATLIVQYSLDDGENWTTLDFGSVISLSGASGDHQILINHATFKLIRVALTGVAGSADVVASVKSSAEGV